MTHDPKRWRPEFPILGTSTYMISNSLGAMPKGTAGRMAEYATMWATRGVRAWEEGWWEMPTAVGDLLAPIIGAPKQSVIMHQNVTIAEAVVLSCFEPSGARNRIVCERENFPSVMYYYAQQHGLELVTVPVEKLVDAIDERTLLVPTSHVLFKSSYLQNALAIVEKAHKVGAKVILDCFQSAGVLPFSVSDLKVDFAVGGCLKWLCGGPGNGWLYVRPDLIDTLEPRFTGWMAHEAPFTFDAGPMRYTKGPMRFLNGTPQIPALYAATEGLRIINEVGVRIIREYSQQLTSRMLEKVQELGWPTLTPADSSRRGGTVCTNPANSQEISRGLLDHNVLIDWRPDAGIRISPHFYNTIDECDEVIAEIASLLAHRPGLRSTLGR
ncbi:MAG TPA: aminotransferase class V-fold PLP-dependent enzyme [Gemmatimonadales bacterium]|jgi:kynureninase